MGNQLFDLHYYYQMSLLIKIDNVLKISQRRNGWICMYCLHATCDTTWVTSFVTREGSQRAHNWKDECLSILCRLEGNT